MKAKLLPGPAWWHIVQSLLVLCGGFRVVGGVWQSPQVVICGWVNFQSTPGPLRWQNVHSPVVGCGGLRSVGRLWHVAPGLGCVNFQLLPGLWWHWAHVPLRWPDGRVWQSAQLAPWPGWLNFQFTPVWWHCVQLVRLACVAAGFVWQDVQFAEELGCENAQLTPRLWWQEAHSPV